MASSPPAPSREKRPSAAVNGGDDAGGPERKERSKKTVVLRNKGADELFEVEEAAARLSVILGHQIDNGYDPIFVDMQSSILTKIVEYCNKHSPSVSGAYIL